MVEVKCSNIQYKMLIDALESAPLYKGKCFLRKDVVSCPSMKDDSTLTCGECLKQHIKQVK